jgi:hypothetical protein
MGRVLVLHERGSEGERVCAVCALAKAGGHACVACNIVSMSVCVRDVCVCLCFAGGGCRTANRRHGISGAREHLLVGIP